MFLTIDVIDTLTIDVIDILTIDAIDGVLTIDAIAYHKLFHRVILI